MTSHKRNGAPFSFIRLCIELGILIGMVSFPIVVLSLWLLPDFPFSPQVGVFVWWLFNVWAQLYLRRLWYKASQNFRAAIPYDVEEAHAGKGTVHSYGELWDWWRKRSAPPKIDA